jgi:hypothetical protein
MTKNGEVSNMPAAEYFAHKAMSASDAMGLLSKSPLRFNYERTHATEPTAAMSFGSAAHSLVLDDGTFESGFEVLPHDHNGRTKDGKELVASIKSAGKTPVSTDDYVTIQKMAKALKAHPLAKSAFLNGVAEKSFFWQCAETGVECRGRLDWMPNAPGANIFPDYKTTASVTPDDLQKSMWNYGYYIRSAWYQDGLKSIGVQDPVYLMVFQEKVEPFEIVMVQPDQTALQWGWLQCQRARRLFAEYSAKNEWPGWADSAIMQIGLPGWAENQLQRRHENGDFT